MKKTTHTTIQLILALCLAASSFAEDAEHYVDKIHFDRNSMVADFISNNHDPYVYATDNHGTTYPFTDGDLGHLVIQPRTSSPRDIIFATGSGTPEPRLIISGSGSTTVTGDLGVSSLTLTSGLPNYFTARNEAFVYSAAHDFAGDTSMKGALVLQSRSSASRPIIFVTGDTPNEKMRLSSNGNLGIGTISPTHKLSVNGTIRAKEVIVDTGWSDFVFEDDYELRSLREVESHIEEHGHLPDVPSASLVESEGLSVGEAQKIMMQKIEELTLYMIEKDKQVAALQVRVAELESN